MSKKNKSLNRTKILSINKDLEESIRNFFDGDDIEFSESALADSLINAVFDNAVLAPVKITYENGKNYPEFLLGTGGISDNADDKGIIIQSEFVENESGEICLPLFTSVKEMNAGNFPGKECRLEKLSILLSVVLDMDIDGVVFNPYGPYSLRLTQENIKDLFDTMQDMLTDNDAVIQIVLEDITAIKADAIVNASNNTLLGGSGVDGAINAAAGPRLREACRKLRGCRTGEAKVTPGFNLRADHIIHTVGPYYTGGPEDEKLLASCYWNSLEAALECGAEKVAFPCISTGAYGYPKEEAAVIAVETVLSWLDAHSEEEQISVIFCIYDQENYDIYADVLGEYLGEADLEGTYRDFQTLYYDDEDDIPDDETANEFYIRDYEGDITDNEADTDDDGGDGDDNPFM